ncbi:hypothetical protein AC578_2702 [Pseudocercospora eumusae]|uniref:SH3 domain-containing protein n=1 Tax=Pseudocercospora eumusae TaxID=321146 RepID=A0A139HFU8_9PEZI|nr:hypothetical protein AC578_2702 [Pseudocercospora eumusae]
MPNNENALSNVVHGDLNWRHEFATARDHARQHNGNHHGNIIYNFYASETPFSHSFPAAADPDRAQFQSITERDKIAARSKIVGVVKVDYDFHSQERDELQVVEGDILLVLDKTTSSEWWHCKKLLPMADVADEPIGVIPSSYISPLWPLQTAYAGFDYQRRTDEELSMIEGEMLAVLDKRDPDWTLIALDGAYGYVPASYIRYSAGT